MAENLENQMGQMLEQMRSMDEEIQSLKIQNAKNSEQSEEVEAKDTTGEKPAEEKSKKKQNAPGQAMGSSSHHDIYKCIERTYREFLLRVQEHSTNDTSDAALGFWVRNLGTQIPRQRPTGGKRKRN
ncbi:uncharacterized protein [Clytia hemisphaerica]|uniref:Uncharacterized protein n=1 Tax=Clytia hemisphaerica TaxID=252671 RepID=A0A7M5V5R3_9CNID